MRRRAFSLVETVLATATLAVALTLLMMLVQQYVRVGRHSNELGVQIALRDVLHGLVEETRTAIEIQQPPENTAGTLLRFTRVRPTAPPVAGPDPWPAPRLMTVTYYLQGGRLWRQVSWPGATPGPEAVAAELVGFRVERGPGQPFSITLTSETSGQVGTLREASRLWHE